MELLLCSFARSDFKDCSGGIASQTDKSESSAEDLSGDEVDKLMHRYKQELGAPCGYCHVENAETKQIDFASDENPIKQTARMMIGMTGDINAKYLAQLGDRRYAEPLTCGNCHQGQIDPPMFEAKPHMN